jgi:hypothetical protein
VHHKPHVCGLKIFYKYNSLSLTRLLWIQRFTRRLKWILVTKRKGLMIAWKEMRGVYEQVSERFEM